MSARDEDLQKIFRGYLSSRKVLVADPAKVSRASLVKIMIELGAKPEKILQAETYAQAEALLNAEHPVVLVCEYDFDKRCGLELMQSFREKNPDTNNSLFALVTGNSSQSVVAQAAEEDVDTFMLKPFTAAVVRQILTKAAVAKLSPPHYQKKVEEGKKLLNEKKYDEATKTFEEAIGLDPRPALAKYYLGQVALCLGKPDEAVAIFEQGIAINKLHYKCLNGLYETLMQQKKHSEAYEVVKKLSRYFPANPKRLAAVLRLAIMTKNVEDIERYYQIFTNIDQREEELVQYVCAALVVCGKYYLKANFPSRGLELFNNAALTAGKRTKFLKEIVMSLADHGFNKDAMIHLMKFPVEEQKKIEFLSLQLALQDLDQPVAKIIENGQKLITEGHTDPIIYRVLIKRLSESNQKSAAETMLSDAIKRYPDQQSAFDRAYKGDLKNVITGV